MNHFGKDQHELLIRQLFHIHQTGVVQEYVTRFSTLIDQLQAYGCNIDPIYYAMRFVNGLRADIRSDVHMQCPTTLDTACTLALLQEELEDPTMHLEVRRPEPFTFAKVQARGPCRLIHSKRAERGNRPLAPGVDHHGRRVVE